MKRKIVAVFAAGTLLLSVPAGAQDKATIDKLNAEFMTAFDKGDMAAIGQMYTEEAYLLPPGAEIVKGRAAIQAFWTKAAEGIGDLKLMTSDMKALGSDAAREVGTFTLKTKGQQSQEVAGKYVVVWEKADGQWRLATDIWIRTSRPQRIAAYTRRASPPEG
jgi:uncharacterized protein (TIGR02246 family)